MFFAGRKKKRILLKYYQPLREITDEKIFEKRDLGASIAVVTDDHYYLFDKPIDEELVYHVLDKIQELLIKYPEKYDVLETPDEVIDKAVVMLFEKKKIPRKPSENELHIIKRHLLALGFIYTLLFDDSLTDIKVSADAPIVVIHNRKDVLLTNIYVTEKDFRIFAENIASLMNKSVNVAMPLVEGTLELDDITARITINYSKETGDRVIIIRKFARKKWTPISYVIEKTVSPEILATMAYAFYNNISVLVTGRPNTGKTTLIFVVSQLLPIPQMPLTIISDTKEIKLDFTTITFLQTRQPQSLGAIIKEVSMEELLRVALRTSARYIVISEVRDKELNAFFEAIQISPGMTSYHSDDIESLINRFIAQAGDKEKVREVLKTINLVGIMKVERIVYKGQTLVVKFLSSLYFVENLIERKYYILFKRDHYEDDYIFFDENFDKFARLLVSKKYSKPMEEVTTSEIEHVKKDINLLAEFIKNLVEEYKINPSIDNPKEIISRVSAFYTNKLLRRLIEEKATMVPEQPAMVKRTVVVQAQKGQRIITARTPSKTSISKRTGLKKASDSDIDKALEKLRKLREEI